MVASSAETITRTTKKAKYGYHDADKVKVSKGNKTKRGVQRPMWSEPTEY